MRKRADDHGRPGSRSPTPSPGGRSPWEGPAASSEGVELGSVSPRGQGCSALTGQDHTPSWGGLRLHCSNQDDTLARWGGGAGVIPGARWAGKHSVPVGRDVR